MIRLDKLLADAGFGTRSEVKKLLRAKRVTVDGKVETSPDRKVDPESVTICVDGQAVKYQRYAYYLLNKPKGVITATTDSYHRTVMDLLTGVKDKNLSPVGRLDLDTEGLLLITNEGALAHALLAPGRHVDKVYECTLLREADASCVDAFAKGIVLEDGTVCLPATCEVAGTFAKVTLHEGKFHQVKRMWEALGNEVVALKRVQMGGLRLPDDLGPGEFRELTEEEKRELLGE